MKTMAEIVKELTLDVARENRIQAVLGKQYDYNSRYLKVHIANEGVPLVIAGNSVATINATRADGKSNSFLGEVNGDGTVTVPITQWMLALDDTVKCDISIVDEDGRKLSTTNFTIEVERANYGGGDLAEVTASVGSSKGITGAAVDGVTFIQKVGTPEEKTYTFSFNGTKWLLNSVEVALDDYGITVTGTPVNGDAVTVTVAENTADVLLQLVEQVTALEASVKTAEAGRVSAENSRVSAEKARVTAENERKSAETDRVTNENARKTAETSRSTAESTRKTNESTRQANETTRKSNETSRVTAETARSNAESARVSAENERAAAELVREQKTAECIAATEKCEMVTESVLTKFSTFADVQRITRLGYHDDLIPVGNQFVVNREKTMAISVGASTGITSATVNPQTFIEKVGEAFNGQYEATYDGDVWHKADNTVIVLSDYGVTVVGTPVAGDHIVITGTAEELTFDVLDHDKHTPENSGLTHSLALGMHNIFIYGTMPFCAPQLMYWSENGLPAGTYKLTLDHAQYGGGTLYDGTYMFTLTKAIPADGGFRHTKPVGGWQSSYAKTDILGNYITTYGARPQRSAIESGVAFSEYDGTTECTDLGTFTARSRTYYAEDDTVNGGKRNFTERQAYGSNRWRDSVYRQWLNSTAPAGTTGNGVSNWWTPQSVFDRAPGGANSAGFLYGLDPSFVTAMGKVKVITALCDCDKVDGATQDITYDKVWLQSMTEVFGNTNNSISEGVRLAYWNGSTDADRIKYHNGTARYWWLRSPYPTIASNVRYVSSSGDLNNNRAYGAYGVVPACCIV